jgi:hypothetical protein
VVLALSGTVCFATDMHAMAAVPQAELRKALSNSFRERMNVRHERERRHFRKGIERVRYDTDILLGMKLIEAHLIR